MSTPRRFLVVANPISGGGAARHLVPELVAALAARGHAATVHFTRHAGDGRDRVATAHAEPFDAVVACGGDGTVLEVLNGMAALDRPLGVLPIGTANVLALELGLPRRPGEVAALLDVGTTRTLAVGLAGDRRFLLFCGAGLDGAVVHRLAAVRTGTLGKHRWLGPILHTTWHWPQHRLRVTFADGTVLDDLSSVLVTRVRNYGGVIRLPASIAVDDGKLHVLCFRARSRWSWAWLGLCGWFGRLGPNRWLSVHQATGLRIDGAAPVQLDGDAAGSTPIAIRVHDRSVTLFAPSPRIAPH